MPVISRGSVGDFPVMATMDTHASFFTTKSYCNWSRLITAVRNFPGSLSDLLVSHKRVTLETSHQRYDIFQNAGEELRVEGTRIRHGGLFGWIKSIIFSITHRSDATSLQRREKIIKACIENSPSIVCRHFPEYEKRLNRIGIDTETIALLNLCLDDEAINELSKKLIFDKSTLDQVLNTPLPATVRKNISRIMDKENNLLQMGKVDTTHDDLRSDVIKRVQEKNFKKYSQDVIYFAEKWGTGDFDSVRVIIDILKKNGGQIPSNLEKIYFHRTVERQYLNEFNETISNNKGAAARITDDRRLELVLPLPILKVIRNICASSKYSHTHDCNKKMKKFIIKRLCEERIHILKGSNGKSYFLKNPVDSSEKLKENDLVIDITVKKKNIELKDILEQNINPIFVMNNIIFDETKMSEVDKEEILPLVYGEENFNKLELSGNSLLMANQLPHGGLNFLTSTSKKIDNIYHEGRNASIWVTLSDVFRYGGRIYKDNRAIDKRAVIVELPQNAELKFAYSE